MSEWGVLIGLEVVVWERHSAGGSGREPGMVDIFTRKAVLDILMRQNFENHHMDPSPVLRLNASAVWLKLWSLHRNPAPNASTRWWINHPPLSAR